MNKHINHLLVIILLAASCITEIEPASIGFDDLLVVEGLITDQPVKHQIKISRTAPINSKEPRPVSNAVVRVEATDQSTIMFFEEEPGIYRSGLPIRAKFGTGYRLKITIEGREYESTEVEMIATPQIDRIAAEFVPKKTAALGPSFKNLGDFNFYLEAKTNETPTRAFRYLWNETYKLQVPNPSRWKWLGGSVFEFRREDIPEEQQEFCYGHNSNKTVILNRTLASNGEVTSYPIHSFDAETRQMNIRYSIEVIQYGLSPESERYWAGLAASSQSQGTLFDIQPGTITGNLKAVAAQDEIVLGVFEVAQERRHRVFFRASDFYSQGFSTTGKYWVDCEDMEQITLPIAEAGPFMAKHFETYELLFYSTSFAPGGGPAVLGLKRCALCTLYGTNKRPEFWID